MPISAIEVHVGKRTYRIVGEQVWVRAFGTTGPGQQPHYNWIEVEKGSGSWLEAKNESKG